MEEITKLIPTELILEIYGDLAKPGVQNVGKALGSILGLGNTILLPVQMLNEVAAARVRHNLDIYRAKLAAIDSKNIEALDPELAIPILEKLTYVEDADIADLYASLLATASDSSSFGRAHPSYTRIIESLTADEARIISLLAKNGVIPHQTIHSTSVDLESGKRRTGFARRYRIVAFSPDSIDLSFPNQATLYAENLEGLGILHNQDTKLKHISWYDEVNAVNDEYVQSWEAENSDLEITRSFGHYKLTTLGAEFIIACGFDDHETVSRFRRFS